MIDKRAILYYVSNMSTMYRHTGKISRKPHLPRQPVFDYVALMEALKEYRYPRDKVTSLLRDGTITRVKKGLYVANADVGAASPVSAYPLWEVLANLMYGPSYVSLQYALHLYGMIPEHAVQVTSVTFKKSKRYQTPLGQFVYRSVPHVHYVPGVILRSTDESVSYLVASREKALMDTLYFTAGLRSVRDVHACILDDLRIDVDAVEQLDFELLSVIEEASGSRKLSLCTRALEKMSS